MALTKVKSEQLDAAQTNITSVGTLTGLTVSGDLTVDTSTLVVDSTNNRVGIFNSSPAAKLDIVEATSTTAVKIKSGTSTNQNTHITMFNDNDGGTLSLGVFGSGATTFGTITATDGFVTSNQELCLNSQNASGAIKFGVGSTPTERMRIDTSGNVGIGAASPSTKLHIGGTAPGDSIIRQDSTVSGTNWEIGERAAGKWQIFEDDGDSIVATFMSTGNVGIGTSSPNAAADLHVADTSDTRIWIEATSGDTMELYAGTNVSVFNRSNNALTFGTNNTERMRIDPSGQIFFQKSSENIGVAGMQFLTNGLTQLTASGTPLYLNRLSSDGEIVSLRKDGTTVGSIGVESGNNLIIEAAATDHAGLLLWGSAGEGRITPRLNGVNNDGNVDLGRAAQRFKNLYLSGGVNFSDATGGISYSAGNAANTLDDYEEGTWTPTLPTGGTAGNNYASYVKIGSLVIAYTYVNAASVPNNANQFRIGGLPFAAHANANYYAGGSLSYSGSFNTNAFTDPLVKNNDTYIYFHTNTGSSSSVLNSAIYGATRYFIIQVVYHTAF